MDLVDKIAIVGVGLIGGSFALACKKNALCKQVIGVDLNPAHLATALSLGIIDEVLTLDQAIKEAQLVVIAIPVNATRMLLPLILSKINTQLVVDLGSTKSGICKEVAQHVNRAFFVAAHPIAGTENSGPEAAIANLFENKTTIICNSNETGREQLKLIEQLFNGMEMKLAYMDAEEHDRHIAYVSHLSHISSFVLGKTVLEIEKDEQNIFTMAGSGFASTVRLAKSSPDMWAPIFQQNKPALKQALAAYIKNLQLFQELIEAGDEAALKAIMIEANAIRKVIP